jgi:sugar-specific transcriptional regulator TrmB
MHIPEEYVQVLADLGLTHTEAKVYIVLLCLERATANRIHLESNVARQDVYRVLSDLEERDLIEKIIAKPTKFIPLPPSEAISILLKKRKDRNKQLGNRAKQLFRNFKHACVETLPLSEATRFILLSKSETNPLGHIDKPGKSVGSAQNSVMGLITFPLFMKVKYKDEHVWKKSVKRGVKFRFMISGRSNAKRTLSFDPILKNSNCFKVRWLSEAVPATVLLIDDKEAFCRTGVKIDNPVLWSSASSFVAMIKDYLETKWKSLENNQL